MKPISKKNSLLNDTWGTVVAQDGGQIPENASPGPGSPPPATEGIAEKPEALNLLDIVRSGSEDELSSAVTAQVTALTSQDALKGYTVILLYDEWGSIDSFHANRIYTALGEAGGEKDVLLIVHSNGGRIEPAYLLSRTCKRLASSRFVVAVPRRAKSAATLIALGADEIHMGLLSELGPIDPQVGNAPALALRNALDELARLSEKYPNSSSMLCDYLSKNVPDLRYLGYLARVQKSASQYAERLLGEKPLPEGCTAKGQAEHFAEHYEDHGFVIDIEEALKLLGHDIVKYGTAEYQAANEVYSFLDFVAYLLQVHKNWRICYVGSVSQRPDIVPLSPTA